MHRFSRLFSLAVILGMFLVPASASAASAPTAAAPDKRVAAQIKISQKATARAVRAAERGDHAAVARFSKQARRAAVNAGRLARKGTTATPSTTVWSLSAAAGQQAAVITAFQDAVGTVDPTAQAALTVGLEGLLASRDRLIATLAELAPQLTGVASQQAASALLVLTEQSAALLTDLGEVATVTEIVPVVLSRVTNMIDALSAIITDNLAVVEDLVPGLSGNVQDLVREQLDYVSGIIAAVLGGPPAQTEGDATREPTGGVLGGLLRLPGGILQAIFTPLGLR